LIAIMLSALPPVLIATLAGLALLATLSGSLQRALAEPDQRDSAIVAFLITASGISLLGIGSAFWGLLGGMLTYLILSPRRRA
jgi:benzoate membrane transport protein